MAHETNGEVSTATEVPTVPTTAPKGAGRPKGSQNTAAMEWFTGQMRARVGDFAGKFMEMDRKQLVRLHDDCANRMASALEAGTNVPQLKAVIEASAQVAIVAMRIAEVTRQDGERMIRELAADFEVTNRPR